MDYVKKLGIGAIGTAAAIFAAVPLMPSGHASAATTTPPAATHHAQLPAWLHWQAASRSVARDACGHWRNGTTVPGVKVWTGAGDTVTVHCANGKIATS